MSEVDVSDSDSEATLMLETEYENSDSEREVEVQSLDLEVETQLGPASQSQSKPSQENSNTEGETRSAGLTANAELELFDIFSDSDEETSEKRTEEEMPAKKRREEEKPSKEEKPDSKGETLGPNATAVQALYRMPMSDLVGTRNGEGESAEINEINISNLSEVLTAEVIEKYFCSLGRHCFGYHCSCKLHSSSDNKPFGFVTFETFEIVELIMAQSHTIKGRLIRCNYSNRTNAKRPSKEMPVMAKPYELHVSNLVPGMTEEDIYKHFKKHGALGVTRMVMKKVSGDPWFCFVAFKTREEVDRVESLWHWVNGSLVTCTWSTTNK